MAIILYVEPTPYLRVTIVGDDIVADELIVVPNGTTLSIFNRRRFTILFAEIKAFAIGRNDISFNDAVRAAG